MKFKFSLPVLILISSLGSLRAQDATTLYNEGVKLKGDKKIPEAIDKFKKALALRSDYTEARYELGWCYNDLKEYASALSNLRQARNGWSNIPKVFFELGYAFEKLEMYDSAVAAFNRCLELKPDYSGVPREMGNIAYFRDEHEKTLYWYRQYEQVAKNPITDYQFYYRRGYSYNALKRYDSAITALNRSLDLNDKYTNTWLELGFAYTRLKKADEAISNFNKAKELDPASHVPLNGIAEVYRDVIKDREEAMNWYKKSLEVKPRESKACYGMGYCLNTQGKCTEAIPYLRTAIEQESTYTAAYVELGYALYKTGKYDEAITNLRQALTLNNANENARYYLTLVYIARRDKTNAQKTVDELRKLSSKYTAELQAKVDGM